MLAKFPEVFKDELGTLRGAEATIHVEQGAQPIYLWPRPVPLALRPKVALELERLERDGVIEPVAFSEWAAPIVPVVKPDGSIRICGDFKVTVNKVAKRDMYPLPRVEELFASLAEGETFTKLDLSHAYQQILLSEESKQYVTINTFRGLYRYNRLPFGVSAAPSIFQRTMENLLQGIPQVAVYIDDILVTGKSAAEHLHHLEEVLHRIDSAGMRLKRSKCRFMLPEVQYLGHRISKAGVRPAEEKVRTIQEAPVPTIVTQLKSFLDCSTYMASFSPAYRTCWHHFISYCRRSPLGPGVRANRKPSRQPRLNCLLPVCWCTTALPGNWLFSVMLPATGLALC